MNYCQIGGDNGETKTHLLSLIDFLYKEALSSGGDGDAFWYSLFYNIEDIKVLIEEYNSKLRFPWEIHYDKEKQTLNWGQYQEWVMISNNEEWYKTIPSWAQIVVKY